MKSGHVLAVGKSAREGRRPPAGLTRRDSCSNSRVPGGRRVLEKALRGEARCSSPDGERGRGSGLRGNPRTRRSALMESRTTRQFCRLFSALPSDVQREAKRAYRPFQTDPMHPGLQFKKLQGEDDIFSARIGHGYRALATMSRGGLFGTGLAVIQSMIAWSEPEYERDARVAVMPHRSHLPTKAPT